MTIVSLLNVKLAAVIEVDRILVSLSSPKLAVNSVSVWFRFRWYALQRVSVSAESRDFGAK